MNQAPIVQQEPTQHHHHLVCWKSIFGGVLIAVMSYMTLTVLGAGIGGLTASSLISNERGGAGLATGAGLWLGASAIISLFMGSYFSLRISNYLTNKVGAAHGFIVASIFFVLMTWAASSGVGSLTTGIAKMVGAMGSASESLASQPVVQDTFNQAFRNTQLKSDPAEVAQGLAVRLMRGETESAKSYYAYQTGLTQAEVDSRFAQMKSDFDLKMKAAGESAANAIADAGWSLFVTFLVGLIAAVVGGRVGAQANNRRPIAVQQSTDYRVQAPARV
jgi:hypothetical protein